ncbi:bifunctional adenosylcobinamide kinase/adenosylcobinamide-phosphate guanylyltransferase [Pseudahrensia aquimaris]|uniref:Bifunctional adenosylcobalamin biosynthesis protein n=1 Tax=Pseudahrensia aquimaris TaxID=744461 RepID=A0ABW3FGU6_9HYPH
MSTFHAGVSLILGGARSGKSAFAESLADASGRRKIYLATSQAFDGEMEKRIDLHKQRRGPEWHLLEEPLALGQAVADHAADDACILVDCLTLWLTNLMMAERDVAAACAALVEGFADLPEGASVLFVSNEVGQGIVPMEKMARDFRDHAGRLHQDIASACDHVWFVTAGLPQKLK